MKTITLTIPENAKITVDGVEWPTSTEVKLWTPKDGDDYLALGAKGEISDFMWANDDFDNHRMSAGNIRPTREYAEALDRKRRAESIIFRYFYERGIDTRWKEGVEQFGVYLGSGKLIANPYINVCDGSPFCVESKAIAEQAIADIPDAIRTVLMGGWV